MSSAPLFNRVALIGFGLIGGSIARATRARVFSERAVVTISLASPWARAARAIEPPISPKPISATRRKIGTVFTCPP